MAEFDIVDLTPDEERDIEPVENNDPFSAEYAPGVQLIVQMRIYDVLMAIYTEMNAERATVLLEKHAQGKIIGPMPSIDM